MNTIYKDEKRELIVNGGTLILKGKNIKEVQLLGIEIGRIGIDKKIREGLLKNGENPDEWVSISVKKVGKYGGAVLAVVPAACKISIEAEIYKYEKEIEDYKNQPLVAERCKIELMFREAKKLIDYPGEYYPAILRAEKMLAEWKIKFPEGAKEEEKKELISQATQKEALAKGALTYDADGWIDAKGRQERHDKFMEEAVALRKQATKL